MSENSKESDRLVEPRNPFSSLFPNLKFEFPFLKPKGSSSSEAMVGEEEPSREIEARAPRPAMARFPRTNVEFPSPEVVENEETGKTSNPIVLWQVYALGGFLVLRWFWARWNERRGRNQNSTAGDNDDDDDDDPSSAE